MLSGPGDVLVFLIFLRALVSSKRVMGSSWPAGGVRSILSSSFLRKVCCAAGRLVVELAFEKCSQKAVAFSLAVFRGLPSEDSRSGSGGL